MSSRLKIQIDLNWLNDKVDAHETAEKITFNLYNIKNEFLYAILAYYLFLQDIILDKYKREGIF